MLKNSQKRCFEMMEQQRQPHQRRQEIENIQSVMTYAADKYDHQSSSSSMSDTGSEQDWTSPTDAKRSRLFIEGHGANCSEASSANQLHTLAQEPSNSQRPVADDERRKVRRERNKLAAARCRQRRLDLTNSLIVETEALENEKVKLEKEIENLYRQTNELQFVLESHSKRCQMNTNFSDSLMAPVDLTAVKVEKPDISAGLKENSGSRTAKFGMGRPTTLSIGSSLATTSSMDTPFSRPNAMLCSLTLDFLAEGRTGLTPTTGLPSAAEVPSSTERLPPNQTLINL